MNRLMLVVVGILTLIVLSFVPVSVHAQDATPNLEVRVDHEESVRNGPGLEFATLGSLAAGTVMRVANCNADCSWLEVSPSIWIAASQVTPVIASSQPNGTLIVPAPAAANAAAPLPTPIPTSVPLSTEVVPPTPTVLAVAVTPMPPLLLAPANDPVSQAPETPRAITTVIAPGTEVDGLKAKAVSYNVRELTRNIKNYVGHSIVYSGRVLQVIENRTLFSDQVTYTLAFAVDDNYENMITANLVYEDGQGLRPLEGDWLTIWGTVEGSETYTNGQGAVVTLPAVRIHYLETEGEQESTAEAVNADVITIVSSPTLKVLSHTKQGSNDFLYIYGEVQNQSDYPVDGVKVVAVLRNANGNVVYSDTRDSLLNTIPANGKSPFSIGFASWQNVTSYDIKVEGEMGTPTREDLFIRSPNSNVEGSSLRIAGEVANTGTTPAQSVKVIITLYDNTGRVVGSDYAYKTLSTIPAGGTVAFSISTSLPEDYSYYEMQVEGR